MMAEADEPPELYAVPSLEDAEYWERFHAAGLHQPDQAAIAANGHGGRFAWVDLSHDDYATPPDPPTVKGLLYAGRRHVISGPPESTKTLIAYMLLVEALRQDRGICILDFEMGPHAAATLLREIGATDDQLQRTQYAEPDAPPTTEDIDRIVGLGTQYALIDAAAGAYDATGLDDNARKDVEQFASKWIRPLWQAGVATIVIDHVTKDSATRGKFTIGSERKTGQADVHLSLEALKPLHRGGTGLVKINVHKDRPGHLPRPTAYFVDLRSDEQHRITWELREPLEATGEGEFRHTIYMERISRHMEHDPARSYSKNELETDVSGKAEHIRAGLRELLADGYVTVTETSRGHDRYTLLRPFVPTSSPPRPDEGSTHFVPSSHPLQGGRGDEDEVDETNLVPRPDVYDPHVQALLDDDDIPF